MVDGLVESVLVIDLCASVDECKEIFAHHVLWQIELRPVLHFIRFGQEERNAFLRADLRRSIGF